MRECQNNFTSISAFRKPLERRCQRSRTFLAPFHVQFRQRKGTENLERYVTGLLNEYPNKNCETLASVVPGTHPQRLHNLLTDLAWDEADLNPIPFNEA
nr:hypothetical protein [Gammaproteobacteria bacterium]